MRRADAELARWSDREDPAVLDDRDAVGELLRLVEIVRRQQDRLAELAQLAHRLPCAAARLGIEAGRRLVEEDQLGIADQREREVQPAQLPAGELAAALVGLLLQAGEREHLLDVARARIEARPVAQRLARRDVRVDAAGLQHDADSLAQRAAAAARVEAEHRDLAAAARAVALEDLDRRRLAGAVRPEQPEDLAAAHADVDSADGLELAVSLAQRAHLDRRRRVVHGLIIAMARSGMRGRARRAALRASR